MQQVPSNQRSILNFMRRAEEAGYITAGKYSSPIEAVAEDASDSKKAKRIKQEPVKHADNDLSVKIDEEPKYTLHDIPEMNVPFNPEECVGVTLRGKSLEDLIKYNEMEL
ncbi:hypothetical protein BDV36DRAFT_295181 [Aspergillus pseudocaelatus]|uniref:Uncharacterized protein n=1 Tax=Aspergillus pseudocaelatus TaxID=1825620 RepID=A0ABQ6WMI8_9EURO|nr:hypothetical protein BDV36DRAFT_295181 [Aspergillus pseudocaelatus]